MFFDNKYKLVLLKKTQLGYTQIKILGLNPAKVARKWKGGEYKYNLGEVSYQKGRKHFIFKDFDTGDSLTFNNIPADVLPTDADAMNATSLIKAAISQVSGNYGLLMLILCLVAGLAIGFLLGQNIESIVSTVQGKPNA